MRAPRLKMKNRVFTMDYFGSVAKITSPCGVTKPGRACIDTSLYGTCTAIWDTGCAITTLSRDLVRDLDLMPTDRGAVKTVGGVVPVTYYKADILLPGGIAIPNVQVTVGDLPSNTVLIGMNVIRNGDLAISNLKGSTTMTFRTPSIAYLDFTTATTAFFKRLFRIH